MNNNELIEKARTYVMAAECTLWNISDWCSNDTLEAFTERNAWSNLAITINALHDAERTLRTLRERSDSEQ